MQVLAKRFLDIPARRRPNLWLTAVFILLASHYSIAQEYKVKAAFIYNFTQFGQWPEEAFDSPEAPFIIGIVGKDPFGSFIDELVLNEKVSGHPIVVKRFAADELSKSHLLFVAEDADHTKVLQAISSPYTLTVGEAPGFTESGGCIGFYTEARKVRFQINGRVLETTRFTLSSRLLRLAKMCCT